MFREMRRKGQQLSTEDCEAILNRGTSGVLAVSDDGDYPYAVPLSYCYDGGKIYFHCAKTGHKLDAIEKNNKASFCVIDADDVVPEKFTTYYKSVVVFGRIHIISGGDEKFKAITALSEKYSPGDKNTQREIEQSWERFCMLELEIEHMTGKAAKELV